MSNEEKEALEILKLYFGEEPTLNITKYVNIVLNLIEKQQKEIEEFKEDRKSYAEEHIHNNPWLYKQLNENYILRTEAENIDKKWEDKIKEILGIEETDSEKILSLLQTIVDENSRLEDIEDRKVQIEYERVFNKGVKLVEDKIKKKIEEQDETKLYWTDEVKDILNSLLRKE